MPDDKDKAGPIQKEKVHVTVTPKDPRDPDHKRAAEKVKEAVKKDVREAIEKAKPEGGDAQLDAADKAVDRAKSGAPRTKVDKIDVKIEGEDAKGDEFTRQRKVKPDG